MEIKNAKIDYVGLYIEDHDILTFGIGLDLGSGGCALGGYALDQSFRVDKNDNRWDYENSQYAKRGCSDRRTTLSSIFSCGTCTENAEQRGLG